MIVMFVVGGPEEVLLATVTAAELPELTAATTALNPLASIAEPASAMMRRVRTFLMSWPLPERPRASAG
jgi:hypothetical protein